MLFVACVVLSALAGCARDVAGEARVPNSFYFPVDVAAPAGGGRFAYVLSANLDHRYNTGWISVIDLEKALGADAEPEVAISDGVDVPSLGASLHIRANDGFLMSTGRGYRSVNVVWPQINQAGDGVSFRCVGSSEPCSEATRVLISADDVGNDARTQDLLSPFSGVFIDLKQEGVLKHYAALAYLGSSFLSLFEVGTDGVFRHVRSALLGNVAVNNLALHPATCGNTRAFLVAGSQPFVSNTQSQMIHVDVDRFLQGKSDAINSTELQSAVGSFSVASSAFAPAANDDCALGNQWLYLASAGAGDAANITVLDAALTNTLVGNVDTPDPYDTRILERPNYDIASALPVGGRLGKTLYIRRDGGDILAVAAFDDDAVYFLSVKDASVQLITRYEEGIGRGPYGLAETSYNGKRYLLVPSFVDHSVSIIDIDGRDPARFKTVARVYNPKTPPTERRP